MSGIYIPDKEMPKNCHLCMYSYLGRDYSRIFCGIDDHYIADLQQWDKPYFWGHKDDSCPIIPVPDHGRLIDADAVYSELTEYYHHSTWFQHEALKEAISRVPTIIPADKEGET